MNYSSMSDDELLNIVNGDSKQTPSTNNYSNMSDDELLNIVNNKPSTQPKQVQPQITQPVQSQVVQNPIIQNNEPSETLTLQGSVKKTTPYQWFRNNIRPAHFLGDLGKSTANAFREESIMGANALTGAKNWTLDKVGLSKWHRPTEEIKAEREALVPKFDINKDAHVANFVGDMLGWAPMFAVGGEGIAAIKGGAKAAQVANAAAKTGRTVEQTAKLIARREAMKAAAKKAAEDAFLKDATVMQQIIRPQTLTNAAKTAHNAGMDMATFEGLRHGLRTLGGEEQENTFGQDVLQGYGMGAAFGAGASTLGSVAKPVAKAIGNTEFAQNISKGFEDMANSNDKIAHFVANARNSFGLGTSKNVNVARYQRFEKMMQESGLPQEEINKNLVEYSNLSKRDKIRVDKAVRKQLMEAKEVPVAEKPQFFGEEPTIQVKQNGLYPIDELNATRPNINKAAEIEKLNNIEQAIDNGTPVTREALNWFTPDEYMSLVEQLKKAQGWDDAQASEFLNQHGIKLKGEPVKQEFEFINEEPIQNKNIIDSDTPEVLTGHVERPNIEYTYDTPEALKGHVKSSEGINTPKEVETPQNDMSIHTQNEHSVKKLPKKIIEPEKTYDNMNVERLESGEAEGSNTSYNKIERQKSAKEADAIQEGLTEEVPNSGKYASQDAEFNKWYDKYENADANTRASMAEEKMYSFKTREEGLDFYNKLENQVERDTQAAQRNATESLVKEDDLLEFASKMKNADSLPSAAKEAKIHNNELTQQQRELNGKQVLEMLGYGQKKDINVWRAMGASRFGKSSKGAKAADKQLEILAFGKLKNQKSKYALDKMYEQMKGRIETYKNEGYDTFRAENALDKAYERKLEQFGIKLNKEIKDIPQHIEGEEAYNTSKQNLRDRYGIKEYAYNDKTVLGIDSLNNKKSNIDFYGDKIQNKKLKTGENQLKDGETIQQWRERQSKSAGLQNKEISIDGNGNTINDKTYNQRLFGKIKAWQQKNSFLKDLKSRSKEMVKDLKEERFLNPDNKEIPPILKKAKKVYEQIKRGEVEYNPEKAYHILTKGFDNKSINGKPIVTTIGDLTKNSVRYGKEFEGLEDVVIHVESGKNGTRGYHEPSTNEIHVSDEESLFHEMQHYIQENFSNISKKQYEVFTEETNRLSKRCEYKHKFYKEHINKLETNFENIVKSGNQKQIDAAEKELYRWYASRDKVNKFYYNRYKNCTLEKEAFEAGSNRTLNRNSNLVNFTGGINHAKGFIKSERLLQTDRTFGTNNKELSGNGGRSKRRQETRTANERSSQRTNEVSRIYQKPSEQPIGLKNIKEPKLDSIKYQKYDKSSGMSPKKWLNEVKDTKKKYGLTDAKAKALVNRAAAEIKTASDETERLLIKRGIITEEQAANRKKMVGSSTYIADTPEYLYDGSIDLNKDYSDTKVGATGKREHRTVKNAHLEKLYKNTQAYSAQAKYVDSVMSRLEKDFSKPITDNKILPGYKAVNSKIVSTALFRKMSKEFVDTLSEGSEAIRKAFKNEEVAKGWEELYKRADKPDMQIPEEIYNSLFSGKGESAADFIERYGSKHPLRASGKLALAVHDAMIERFKQRVLTSGSFFTNNRIGNETLIAAMTKSPTEYVKSLYNVWKLKNSDLPEGLLEANILNEIKSFNIRKKYTGYAPLDNAFNLFGGQLLDTSTLKGMKKVNATAINWFVGKPARWFAKFSDKVMKFNQKFENFERRQAFAIHADRVRNDLIKRTGQKMITLQEVADQINKDSPLKETIIEDIQSTLGDYNNFSRKEQSILKRIIPFYSWYRTISRHTLQLAKKNPTRAALILYELDDIKNNEQQDLKEYQRGSIKLPAKNSLTGENLVVNKMHAFPYMTFREDLGVSPFLQVPAEAIRGKKFFQDQELSNSRYARFYDDKEEKYLDTKTGDVLNRLPATTRLGYIGKQLVWNNILPYGDNPMIDLNKTSGILFNKLSKNKNKVDAGKWQMYDKSYDATVFGGYNIGDIVGTAKYTNKYGKETSKEVKRTGKSRYPKLISVLNRGLGLSIQNENPKDYFSEKEEKESLSHKLSVARRVKAWRNKHKRK